MNRLPVAPPSFIHLGNWPNLAQFVTGLTVGSGGTNAAFAIASAASGGYAACAPILAPLLLT